MKNLNNVLLWRYSNFEDCKYYCAMITCSYLRCNRFGRLTAESEAQIYYQCSRQRDFFEVKILRIIYFAFSLILDSSLDHRQVSSFSSYSSSIFSCYFLMFCLLQESPGRHFPSRHNLQRFCSNLHPHARIQCRLGNFRRPYCSFRRLYSSFLEIFLWKWSFYRIKKSENFAFTRIIFYLCFNLLRLKLLLGLYRLLPRSCVYGALARPKKIRNFTDFYLIEILTWARRRFSKFWDSRLKILWFFGKILTTAEVWLCVSWTSCCECSSADDSSFI